MPVVILKRLVRLIPRASFTAICIAKGRLVGIAAMRAGIYEIAQASRPRCTYQSIFIESSDSRAQWYHPMKFLHRCDSRICIPVVPRRGVVATAWHFTKIKHQPQIPGGLEHSRPERESLRLRTAG